MNSSCLMHLVFLVIKYASLIIDNGSWLEYARYGYELQEENKEELIESPLNEEEDEEDPVEDCSSKEEEEE
ncbi:hypothetical protein FNV43_RR00347 [Rhamnella rubrinervis]|uniref:Uncharacterized protein n=1 Tax=Rhamnella rubrinervis TaxID=2594499 RepID=A0A8K0MSB2_9ROSA|nr:hypothetical protein FNV43_RR00347 [Rhamnella rubrinervis]